MTIDNSKAVEAFYKAEAERNVRLDYPLNENSVVLDLGAYKGEWMEAVYKKYNCRVIACEPVDHLFEEAGKKVKNTKMEVWNYAVGGSNRTEEITVDNDGSNFYNPKGTKATVQVVSIDTFMKMIKIDKFDLVKMNVEGTEFEILERLIELDWLDRFTDLQIQFHPVVPDYDNRRNKIQAVLSKTHQLTYNFEWVWENWRLR